MISNQNTSTDPQLSREEAIEILNTPDENLDELIARAEKLRRKYKGNHVSIHILTNARSGNCSQDCAYCAQSCRSKADIDKYKWVADEKLYADNDFVNEHHLSRHCIGLSGMKFTDAEIEELAEKIRKMKEQGTHLCCSIGFLTEKQALMLKEAGLDRINHNLNSSRAYYHNICSTHTFEQRVSNIKMLQGLGFEICSGGIIGMGESKEDVVDMLLELREIRPEALPINFLLPIPGTPLEHADMSALTTAYCMKVLCLARLLVPQSDIRCAAGREIYFKGEEKNLRTISTKFRPKGTDDSIEVRITAYPEKGNLLFSYDYVLDSPWDSYHTELTMNLLKKAMQMAPEMEVIVNGEQGINFKPKPFNDGKIIGAFAVVLYTDGGMAYDTMSLADLENTRKASKASNSPAWKNFTGEMYKRRFFTDFASILS